MDRAEAMQRIDAQLSHVWMTRTFLKHAPEAEEDDELRDIVRELYDTCLAVGPAWSKQDAEEYLKMIRKKLAKLRTAADQFAAIQADISTHTNFAMAARSLAAAVAEIASLLAAATDPAASAPPRQASAAPPKV